MLNPLMYFPVRKKEAGLTGGTLPPE